MSDEQTNAPEQQGAQSASGQQDSWEARYKGVMRTLNERDQKISSLTEALTRLEQEKSQLATQLEQLNEALKARESELGSTKGSLEAIQKELTEKLSGLQGERDKLAAEVTKWSVLKGYPDLVHLADVIPASTNEDEVKAAVERLHNGIETILESKREQWRAGITPNAQPPKTQFTEEEIYANIQKHAGTPEAEQWIDLWYQTKK